MALSTWKVKAMSSSGTEFLCHINVFDGGVVTLMDDNSGGDQRHWKGTMGGHQELILLPTEKAGSSAESLDFFTFMPLEVGLKATYKGGNNYTWVLTHVEELYL